MAGRTTRVADGRIHMTMMRQKIENGRRRHLQRANLDLGSGTEQTVRNNNRIMGK